jgi:glycine/D-amino acid oxidase-like deaminating enzyme/nitrite reductase/ring-hydroxylating ferredoxin subunit
MDTSSLWQGTAARTACLPTLQTDLKVDVAIVGGGIAGLTTALRLVEAGKRVAILEAHKVGDGASSHSTGNLYATVDLGLAALEQAHGAARGPEIARQVVESRAAAIDLIEATIARFGIDCGYQRVPWHLLALDPAHVADVENEAAAAGRAGLATELIDAAPIAVRATRVLRIPGQAQFQPLDYLRQLAQRIGGEDCLIFENTRVLAVDDDPCVVHTEHGKVVAGQVVLATHTPVGIHLVQSNMEVVREYGVAAVMHDAVPAPGVYWCIGAERYSLRSFTEYERTYLVAVGSSHKTGDAGIGAERFDRLIAFARDQFPLAPVEYRWSAQRYRSRDKLPCIGRNVDARNTYIATGFSGDGLVYGTLAGMLVADQILGQANPWSALYNPARLAQGKRPEGFEQENSGPAKAPQPPMVDRVTRAQLDSLPPCQTRKIEAGGQPVLVYRREDGGLQAVTGKCTHLGCELRWNGADTSWDCDCHGSRFAPDGRVLEGPALAPLASVPLE